MAIDISEVSPISGEYAKKLFEGEGIMNYCIYCGEYLNSTVGHKCAEESVILSRIQMEGSLRDEFAMAALQMSEVRGVLNEGFIHIAVDKAYEIADAMLEARKEK